jgi:hypothetical protein
MKQRGETKMSQQMNPAQVEMVKVGCVRCHRVVRTVANWGVVGEGDLARLGWTTDEHGKALCDECLPPVPTCPYCHGHSTDGSCSVCRVDALLAAKSRGLPPDSAIVEAYRGVVKRLHDAGLIVDDDYDQAVEMSLFVDSLLPEKDEGGF